MTHDQLGTVMRAVELAGTGKSFHDAFRDEAHEGSVMLAAFRWAIQHARKVPCDRADTICCRLVNIGLLDADKAKAAKPHIRCALDAEVAAGGPYTWEVG